MKRTAPLTPDTLVAARHIFGESEQAGEQTTAPSRSRPSARRNAAMFDPGGGGYGCLLSQRIHSVNSVLTGAPAPPGPQGPLCADSK